MSDSKQTSPTTLSSLLTKYLVVLTTVLGIILSYVIQTAYEWGNDDATHYFMQLSAEAYLNTPLESQRILEATEVGSLNIYASFDQIPKNISKHFIDIELTHNHLLFHETPKSFIYLLPYSNQTTADKVYVTSEYLLSAEDLKIESYISQFTLTTILSTLSLSVVLIGIVWKSIFTPIRTLSDWSKKTKDIDTPTSALLDQRPNLRIAELDELGQRIANSMEALSKHNNKEKQFLKALSHELRTPLAIIKASLELIKKTEKDLSQNTLKKLGKIQKANDNMCATSDSLLWLWSGELKKFNREDISVDHLISKIIEDNCYLIEHKNIEINTQVDSATISASSTLLEILIRNLVRNAFQYTPEGNIQIKFNQQKLIIENTIGTNTDAKANMESDYGFGVGIYLSKAICDSQSWKFHQLKTAHTYKITVSF